MRVEVHESIADFREDDWNALAGDRYPFLRHAFLAAAENSGCVTAETGWLPRHIGLYGARGELTAALPLYEKSHSWGEFVFDWSWAQAYQRAGIQYYPKLVSAIPFTPASAWRLLSRNRDPDLAGQLLQQAVKLAQDEGHSSLHVLFPVADELPLLENAGLKLRKDCQFHWHNKGYRSFDEFLAEFSSAKRKKAKRDRRRVAEQGISYRWLDGHQLDRAMWADIYQLISNTFMQRGSLPYFNLDFFIEVTDRLPDNMLVLLAEKNQAIVATAVFYRSADTLYGRYWGCDADINALHFETCYYQGIDYCIAHGIRRFEPGTQGEHKISRGFTPVTTWSAHWLAHPEFFTAIERYLNEEQRHVESYIDAVHQHSPFKQQTSKE